MKKIWTLFFAAMLIVPLLLQPATAQAAKAITITVDGVQLKTDQPPAMIQGRVMLPLRAIFEALGASVNWDSKNQTVTGYKEDTTVVLKMKSKVATINGKSVTLDVPAQILRGRTMVPVRFVSEALGQDVDWNSVNQTVTIQSDTPSNPNIPGNISIAPASHVSVRDVNDQGDGRDMEVSFSRSSTESYVDHYRIMVVKASKSFNLASALKVSPSNYTVVTTSSSNRTINLSQNSRDVDGDYIRNDQPYVVRILAVGKGSYSSVLSTSSPKMTLTNLSSVTEVTNVKINDINDFGDGRDVSVSFTRPQNDNNISNYRVFIVKTKDASNFSLTTANNLSSSYYTTVNKSGSNGSTLVGTLSSSARDTSGEFIRNNVPYTAVVLSVSNTNSVGNKLSSASSSVTLSQNTMSTPIITQVSDVNDFGDGRDLRVSFNNVSNESTINAYRIFVVRANNYSNFTLTKANSLSNTYYTQVNKTGYNITQVLSSGARDTDGYPIQNGVSYRVFVMAVANNSANNVLSSASNTITLFSSNAGAVSNLNASDVSDYGNGRDLFVSFNKAVDESIISHYRILVVPTAYYNNFSLTEANNVSSNNYTTVYKSGKSTYEQALAENTRDVRGNTIKEGTSYRIYVLTVANGIGSNALSAPTSTITLNKNFNVQAVTNLNVADIADNGDGRDVQVTFTKPSNEANVNHYRILIVPTAYYSSFNLSQANSSNYYITEGKGGNIAATRTLDGVRDVRGNFITEGTSYRVYVLTVANGNTPNTYALSSASPVITLSKSKAVQAVSNINVSDIGDYGDGRDLQISFSKPSDESNIGNYRILVVPASKANGFDVNAALKVTDYTDINKGQYSMSLGTGSKDTDGKLITNGQEYRVYILSIGNGNSKAMYNLSFASSAITLVDHSAPVAVENVKLSVQGDKNKYSDIKISFDVKNGQNVTEYRVFMLPKDAADGFKESNAMNNDNSTRIYQNGLSNVSQDLSIELDAFGNPLTSSTEYVAKVLAVVNGNYILSNSSINSVQLLAKPDNINVEPSQDTPINQ
ncbi:Copper amine oxidase N-terminal domain-containing protein [Lysinibacillus sp. TC-37]|nr:Copper amine oxidase N-terminal domain-containing protein [Lysinibacillus sp. SG9]SDB26544.1 Copper amine oxidase N-terminal domain-containing protein [Lysinibacillus sp. TC-37]SFS85084.1 Copper amine oxidase N-terminal domain-containing protein [Lysinibacillus sp. SG55]